MDKTGISRRYAEAVYDIAEASDEIAETEEILNTLVQILKKEKKIKEFLLTPSINFQEKEKIIEKIFCSENKNLVNIIKYIVKKNKLLIIENIREEFLEILYKKNNVLVITAIFSKELSENQKTRLKEKLEKMCGKKIILNIVIDSSIIGGGIVKIGSKVIDGSIKSQIKNIKKVFLNKRCFF